MRKYIFEYYCNRNKPISFKVANFTYLTTKSFFKWFWKSVIFRFCHSIVRMLSEWGQRAVRWPLIETIIPNKNRLRFRKSPIPSVIFNSFFFSLMFAWNQTDNHNINLNVDKLSIKALFATSHINEWDCLQTFESINSN